MTGALADISTASSLVNAQPSDGRAGTGVDAAAASLVKLPQD